jgi:hypothetical protein
VVGRDHQRFTFSAGQFAFSFKFLPDIHAQQQRNLREYLKKDKKCCKNDDYANKADNKSILKDF